MKNDDNRERHYPYEETHAEKVGENLVKLTHGVDTCVRKEHRMPSHLRGEE